MSRTAELLAAGTRHHKAGDLRRAEQLARQLLSEDPGHAGGHNLLGLIAYHAGAWDAALGLFGRAIALAPLVAGYHSNAGLAYKALGRREDALCCFREALRIDPHSAQARSNLDDVLRRVGMEARYRENLVLLHDVLEKTDFGPKYFLIGGLLLGWAREGRIIPHDYFDADFGVLAEDRRSLLDAIDVLKGSGFDLWRTWINSQGAEAEFTLVKDGAKFEFFEMTRQGDGLRSHSFGIDGAGDWWEAVSVVPIRGFGPVGFLGRTWLKPMDHEAYLAACYGNWRVVNKNYHYMKDDLSIVSRVRCRAWPWVQAPDPDGSTG